MKRYGIVAALAATVLLVLGGVSALAGDGGSVRGTFGAQLDGYQETPSVSTPGRGRLQLRLDGNTIQYTLQYSNLEAPPAQAHIHFAQRHVAGAVVAFLCGGGGKPDCPSSGSVSGTIRPADVGVTSGSVAQGIAAGEFAEFVRAIRARATYANVHTSMFAAGEIRGQIARGIGFASSKDD